MAGVVGPAPFRRTALAQALAARGLAEALQALAGHGRQGSALWQALAGRLWQALPGRLCQALAGRLAGWLAGSGWLWQALRLWQALAGSGRLWRACSVSRSHSVFCRV